VTSERDDVFTQARRTPLSRPAVTELAKSVGEARLKEHAPAALDSAGLHVATVIAFALVAAGAHLDPMFTAKLLAEIDADEHVGPLARAAGPEGSVKALTEVLDDADATSHRKALALLVLADVLEAKKEKAPDAAITHARQLSRYALEADSSALLGAAVAKLGDANLATLAAPYVKAAKKQRKLVDDALDDSRRPALEALAETASRGIAVGFTVRREGPAPGRNDTCPCGSGKKYKKCCAQKNETPTFEPGRIDEVTLAEEQAEALRGSELVQLDVTRVPKRAFIAAYRRAVAVRRWDLVDRFIAEAKKRKELDERVVEDMSYLALEAAILARAPDVAQRHLDQLPKKYSDAVALDLAFLRDEPRVMGMLEEDAHVALKEEHDGARAIELAHAILPYRPALGILVARGALHEGRVKESQRLLEKIEDARDRLLLTPLEPWWDFYEAMIEEADEQREERKRVAGEKELRAELRRARQVARKAASEMEKLQERQKEIEDALGQKPLPKKEKEKEQKVVVVAPRPAELEEEKKRLKQKIDELQRIIGEGQEERRELRRKLEDVIEEAKPDDDDGNDEEKENDAPEPDEPGDGIDAPRNVLVPRFSDRASKAMGDLTTAVADGVLSTIAGLAAGRPNSWSYVKQLTKVRGVFSARAGIHHRVLFATGDRNLEVLEVIHRKDLEQTVERLTVSR
jgi:hypothetical protein